jgi:coenzyme PQQ biosynthesis protein PqqD
MTQVTPPEQNCAGNPSAPATRRARRSQGMKGKSTSLRRTIRLALGHRLQTGPSGKEHRLLAPKGSIQLNETAALILSLCNGKLTGEEIVARVVRAQSGARESDVRSFLDAAGRRGWIVES